MTAFGKIAAKMEAQRMRLRDAAVMAAALGLFLVLTTFSFGAL